MQAQISLMQAQIISMRAARKLNGSSIASQCHLNAGSKQLQTGSNQLKTAACKIQLSTLLCLFTNKFRDYYFIKIPFSVIFTQKKKGSEIIISKNP